MNLDIQNIHRLAGITAPRLEENATREVERLAGLFQPGTEVAQRYVSYLKKAAGIKGVEAEVAQPIANGHTLKVRFMRSRRRQVNNDIYKPRYLLFVTPQMGKGTYHVKTQFVCGDGHPDWTRTFTRVTGESLMNNPSRFFQQVEDDRNAPRPKGMRERRRMPSQISEVLDIMEGGRTMFAGEPNVLDEDVARYQQQMARWEERTNTRSSFDGEGLTEHEQQAIGISRMITGLDAPWSLNEENEAPEPAPRRKTGFLRDPLVVESLKTGFDAEFIEEDRKTVLHENGTITFWSPTDGRIQHNARYLSESELSLMDPDAVEDIVEHMRATGWVSTRAGFVLPKGRQLQEARELSGADIRRFFEREGVSTTETREGDGFWIGSGKKALVYWDDSVDPELAGWVWRFGKYESGAVDDKRDLEYLLDRLQEKGLAEAVVVPVKPMMLGAPSYDDTVQQAYQRPPDKGIEELKQLGSTIEEAFRSLYEEHTKARSRRTAAALWEEAKGWLGQIQEVLDRHFNGQMPRDRRVADVERLRHALIQTLQRPQL